MSEKEFDEEDFHLPGDISWGSLKQWFKTIYGRLVSLKECMGHDVTDMDHPRNYWHHNQACQEYLQQLKKVEREIDTAIDLARVTFFDEDSIRIKKKNTRFLRYKPYERDEHSTSINSRDGILSGRPADKEGTIDSTQSD